MQVDNCGCFRCGGIDLEGGIVWSLTFFQLWALMSLLFFFCVSLSILFQSDPKCKPFAFQTYHKRTHFNIRCLQWLLIGYARHIELKLMKSMNLKILQLIFDEIKQLGLEQGLSTVLFLYQTFPSLLSYLFTTTYYIKLLTVLQSACFPVFSISQNDGPQPPKLNTFNCFFFFFLIFKVLPVVTTFRNPYFF